MDTQKVNPYRDTLLSDDFLKSLNWYDLQPIAMDLATSISKEELHIKLLEIFPLAAGQEYVGSLANHYRGRLKHEGVDSLVNQLCKNSMRRLIIGLQVK